MLKYKNSAVILLIISITTSFLTAFMGSAMNVALPIIGEEMKTGEVMLGWITTSYILASVVFLIPFGKLSDINGRMKYLNYGIIIFTIGCFLLAISQSDFQLLIFRALQGIGASLIFINSFSIIVSSYPLEKRGRTLGIVISSVYIGLSIGPFIGGLIVQYFGWRYIFYFSFALGTLVILISYIFINTDWKVSEDEIFDWKGALIFMSAIFSFMLGFSFLPAIYGIILLISGLILFYIYTKYSLTNLNPVLSLNIFRSNKTFTFSNLAALINYSATSAIAFLLSLYLQNIKLLSPRDAGTVLVMQPLFMAVFSPFAGRISDKIEPRIVSSFGMGFIAICLSALCFLNADTSVMYVMICTSLLGFGFALFSSPNSNAIMSSVNHQKVGTASTILALMRMTGQTFSMALVIVILSIFTKNEQNSLQSGSISLIQSIRVSFIIFSALCFLGIFASLARGKMHN